jgi:hypothetical protein
MPPNKLNKLVSFIWSTHQKNEKLLKLISSPLYLFFSLSTHPNVHIEREPRATQSQAKLSITTIKKRQIFKNMTVRKIQNFKNMTIRKIHFFLQFF